MENQNKTRCGPQPRNAPRRVRVSTPHRTLAITAVLALALTGCGGAIGQGGGTEAADEPFKIGLLAPLTGPAVQEGTALERGFTLAIERINANGGVLGQPVEFVVVDDQANAAKSTQLAQRLISQDKVDYLFGTIPGDTAGAVGEVSQAAKIPFSSVILGDPPFCGDYFFPFGEPDMVMLEAIVPYMLEKHGKKVALVGNDYVFPRAYNEKARVMIEDAGGSVAVEEYSPLGTADWQPVVNKIAAAKPDWTLSAVVGGDATAFVNQADQAGLLSTAGLSGVSIMQDFYPGIKGKVEGMVLPARYSDQLEGPANEEFVANYRDTYDFEDPIPGVAANAYEAVQLIARAVEEAGSTDADAIVSAMAGATVEDGVFGSGYFTDDKLFVTNMYLLEIQAGGKYVPVKDLGVITNVGDGSRCS